MEVDRADEVLLVAEAAGRVLHLLDLCSRTEFAYGSLADWAGGRTKLFHPIDNCLNGEPHGGSILRIARLMALAIRFEGHHKISAEAKLRLRLGPTETTAARNSGLAHFQAEGGTMMSSAGTSVFTETCGHVRVLKFSRTVWVY